MKLNTRSGANKNTKWARCNKNIDIIDTLCLGWQF